MSVRELDIDPQRLVHWLRRHPERLSLSILREILPDPDTALPAAEGRAAPVIATATLELGPADPGANWWLVLTARDLSGRHVPEDGEPRNLQEEIGLDAFEAEFVAHDNAEIFVSAQWEGRNGKRRFDRVYARMLSD